jgi:signal transduction histidine kinase
MTNTVEDMLVAGKADLGKLEFQPNPLNLKSFCENIINEIKTNFDSLPSLIFNYHGEAITVADQKLLRHILTNLLSNAFKFSPTEGAIEFKVITNQYKIVFMVQDRGIGIPLLDQQNLFKSFYRASNVGKLQGTGLGLSIVKQCVDLHQGAIAFESEPEIGTIFTVLLPNQSVPLQTSDLKFGCRL